METIDGLTIHRLSPSRLGIYTPPFEGQRTVPVTAAQALRSSGAAAVLDGPMFAFCGSLPRERCVEALYLLHDIKRGVHVPSQRPDYGMTLVVTGGRVSVLDRAQMAGDVAIQLYPELIRNGVVVASRTADTSNVWRAALGWDGRDLLFVVGIGPMRAFAEKLRALGCIEAGYTDGGGSAELLTPSGRAGHSDDRPKGAWLLDMPQSAASASSSLLPAVGAGILAWLLLSGD